MTTLLMPTPETKIVNGGPQLWRISVARYHEMIAAGMLTEDDRLELLEGFMVEKMTVNPPHSFTTDQIRDELTAVLPPAYFAKSQQPITTTDSEPEPDVMIVAGTKRDFVARHPAPENVALVVEVADSTLYQDQTWKKRIYARAGIPVYWIVNLTERQIEVYAQPSGPTLNPTYHQLVTYHEADEIPVVIKGTEIARLSVRNLLP
ncbi:MAG: Uma2 family endonuclease [Chloroflexi bacterium]|nr:Uma2 family endonuclease [Chloroflexota bacterium]